MTTFLLFYIDTYSARQNGYPLAGTTVEIETLIDLDNRSARLVGAPIIVRPAARDSVPSWAEYFQMSDTFWRQGGWFAA